MNSGTKRAHHALERGRDRHWNDWRPGRDSSVRISAPKSIKRSNWLGRLVDSLAKLIDKRQA